MFVVGYISGIAVAIILSAFYLICAVECVSGTSQEAVNQSEKLFVIQYKAHGKPLCIHCQAFFQCSDKLPAKIPVCEDNEDFPLPKDCKCRRIIQTFKLFSRPPPCLG